MTIVSFNDCYNDLLIRGGQTAHKIFNEWRNRKGYESVVKFVQNFSHVHLFAIVPEDVRNVMQVSRHALGNIQAHEQLAYIEDYTTPFAFQHLFHWYIETNKKIPTWTQFRDWMVIGEAAEHWHRPLKEFLEGNYPSGDRQSWSRAARWRLGKVYLSNMRELDLLARLRASGLDIRYHILADVLFRVDFWTENVIVSTFFPNPKYRQGSNTGRKNPAERYFKDANPPFKFLSVEIESQGFGNFWPATETSIRSLVGDIASTNSI